MTDRNLTTLNLRLKNALWTVCLLLAPLFLVALEMFHPAGFTASPGMYQYLSAAHPFQVQYRALAYFGPQWWFILHMIQAPLIGLVAVGLWLLASCAEQDANKTALICVWLGRISTFLFLVGYVELDSIGGIGIGKTILTTQHLVNHGELSHIQSLGISRVLNIIWTDPWVGGVGSFISLFASWAAFVAASTIAISLYITGKTGLAGSALLVGFGWELQVSHTMPHGPIAFSLLAISSHLVKRRQCYSDNLL